MPQRLASTPLSAGAVMSGLHKGRFYRGQHDLGAGCQHPLHVLVGKQIGLIQLPDGLFNAVGLHLRHQITSQGMSV